MGDLNEGLSIFPKELLAEIFCRLPAISLIRFTCVCKTWLSIIKDDDQYAMKRYLARTTSSSNVLDDVDYMIHAATYKSSPCLYSITGSKTFKYLNKFECVPDLTLRVFNSCHGIICFYLELRYQILLCNPSIQEVVLLPPCPNKGCPMLGYDEINKDYKVVSISHVNDLFSVNVYSLRQGYWRSVHVSDALQYTGELFGYGGLNANGRMCNWLFYDSHQWRLVRNVKVLLSFDMVEEVLSAVPMPVCGIHGEHDHELLSSSRWQACISCLPVGRNFNGSFVDIWVLERRNNSKHSNIEDLMWSKMFAVEFPGLQPMWPSNFWLNDKEVFVNVREEVTYTREVYHYNLCTQQLRPTGRKGSISTSSNGYVASQVSIKHLMSPQHECNYGDGGEPNDGQDENSKLDENDGFIFREVSRKGVRWFRSFKLT